MAYNDIVGRFFWTPYKDRAVKVTVTKPEEDGKEQTDESKSM